MTFHQTKIQRPQVKLRNWQIEAKTNCLSQLTQGKKVWVQETVTGGGKTVFGRETALDLYEAGMIDLIIVLAPSIGVERGWLNTFRGSLNATAGPSYQDDTQVWVSTYAGYKAICNALAVRRTKGYLLIADEYHHAEREAFWGRGVSVLGSHAAHVLMLSGTPWRTKGTIALLEEERNTEGNFYYDNNGMVVPDHSYRYADDLASETRGTVTVHFLFQPAEVVDKNGVLHEMPVDPENWQAFADQNCDEPLGKYVTITKDKDTFNPRLEGRTMHQSLISNGLQCLELSRGEIYRASGIKDVSIMHIACASISDASSVELYINSHFPGVKAEKIVSDSASSTKRLEEIQLACRQCSADRPDVIISVGMISEGVDIPAIKVTVYFNRITTLLYMIQLIGRGQRRIWLNEKNSYADQDDLIDQTPSYFLAPAHPYIMWMASEIEKDIKQARKELGQSADDQPVPDGTNTNRTTRDYEVRSAGDMLHMYRCETMAVDRIKLLGVTDRLVDHPAAKQNGVNAMWANWINSLIIDGNGEMAEGEIRNKCQVLGVNFDEASSPSAIKEELSYDEQSRLLSEEAGSIVRSIRHHLEPFKSYEDDGKAYAKTWARLNQVAGIKNFSKATLAEKQKWLNAARAWKAERARVAA